MSPGASLQQFLCAFMSKVSMYLVFAEMPFLYFYSLMLDSLMFVRNSHSPAGKGGADARCRAAPDEQGSSNHAGAQRHLSARPPEGQLHSGQQGELWGHNGQRDSA